jgi:predicted nucleotidyltransferase
MYKEHNVLLKTIHGSNLYGLASTSSDIDLYIVVDASVKPKQTIIDNVDTTLIGLPYFMKQIHKGVPQALEALYSPYTEIDNLSWRDKYYCNSSEVVNTYLRTVKSFALDERHAYKYKKHALRLLYNLNSILEYGFFTPVLSSLQKEHVQSVQDLTKIEYVDMLKNVSIIDLDFLKDI